MFPEHDMWGIDVVIPDFGYLRDNAERVQAIVITHGHEDHIGALPYLLGDVVPVDTPIYATRLAAGLIEAKLSEFPKLGHPNIRRFDAGEAFPRRAVRGRVPGDHALDPRRRGAGDPLAEWTR